MPLINQTNTPESSDQHLANETRARLTELGNSMLLTYGNLLNYRHNNGKDVTPQQFDKAMGKDAKDLKYVMTTLKRLMLRLHPDMKQQLDALVPQNPKKAPK